METRRKDAEARGLSDDFGSRTGLARSERAEGEEGLAGAVEVGVGAGQGQGRVGVARVLLFVAGGTGAGRTRTRSEMVGQRARRARDAGTMVVGVGGRAAAATSAAAEQERDGGHGHRPGWSGRRRERVGSLGRRVATDETWSLVVGALGGLNDGRGARSVRGWWEGEKGSRGGRKGASKDLVKKKKRSTRGVSSQ